MKLNAINVVEIPDIDTPSHIDISSFDSIPEAEEHFKKLVKEYVAQEQDVSMGHGKEGKVRDETDEDIESYIENGYYEIGNSLIMIIHSM